MASKTMRRVRPGELPHHPEAAVQEDPSQPVLRGEGGYDYVCTECGNVLAVGMDPERMDRRIPIRCGRCQTVNVPSDTPVEMSREDPPRPQIAP
jgi:DNA-directed RNA polymerase subunit RPC12/RpoP